jgi:hypothetical protein
LGLFFRLSFHCYHFKQFRLRIDRFIVFTFPYRYNYQPVFHFQENHKESPFISFLAFLEAKAINGSVPIKRRRFTNSSFASVTAVLSGYPVVSA